MPERMSRRPWVEITVRVPQEELVHPEIVRDDLAAAVHEAGYGDCEFSVTDTSPGYGEALGA